MTLGVDQPTAEQWAMVEANRGLVLKYVGKLILRPEEREDAVQDGLFGLLRAAQKFDPETGWQFSTYAYPWIINAVQKGREAAHGRNYRRARREGAEWVPPAGLDVLPEQSGGDGDLDGHVFCAVAIAAMRAECRSRIDHAIVDRIEAGDVMFNGRVARACGVTRETVRKRTKRLAEFARPLLAA